MKAAAEKNISPRFRIFRNGEIAMGRGKASLLENIEKTGSIAEAAEKMEMSYMRAWSLIKTMNACFKSPLVKVARGGKSGGGATLTPTGKTALALYRKMEIDSLKATKNSCRMLRNLLRR
jgi:molybdate transport system regulatory protein